MLRPFFYSVAALIAFSLPAFAVYDQQMRCAVSSENTTITVKQSEITLVQGEEVVLIFGHTGSGNAESVLCFHASVTLSDGQRIHACSMVLRKSANDKLPNILRRTEGGAVLSLYSDDMAYDPIQIEFDCPNNGEQN